jgi:ubiquitin-conjugating enzyme (huntingtin interacting protein 2)
LRTALLSLQALLSCPNPDDPQDGQVAGQFKKDKAEFERTAKFWTEMYAVQKKVDVAAAVKKVSRAERKQRRTDE